MKTKIILIFIVIFFSLHSFGQTFVYGGINYNVLTPTTVEVFQNNSFSGIANIPNTVMNGSTNYTVTRIGDSAFQFTNLTSIIIPNSVTSIGDNAFFYCSSLTTVNIPNSVTSIEDTAFGNCSGLTAITIPNSVISIGNSAFANCIGLTTINIPNSVTSISDSLFGGCTGLTTVTIPDSITYIGVYVFSQCSNLTSVICQSVTPITLAGYYTFGLFNPSACTLYVPSGSEALYEAEAFWTDFNPILPISALNLDDISKEKIISLYPNPAKSFIKIQSNENLTDNFNYKIVDFTGRIVKIGNSKFNEKINIESLTDGNYIIQIETENGKKLTEKLIKN